MKTIVGAAMHFLVDGLCLCCLYLTAQRAGDADLIGVFITYNVLAFLTQPFSGLLADALRHPHWQLLAAVLLLLLAVLVAALPPGATASLVQPPRLFILISLLLGMGNSLFHTWGGKQIAVATGNDIRALGVFVSTGAFGLAVGIVCCSWSLLYAMLTAIGLLALAYLYADKGEAAPPLRPSPSKKIHPAFAGVCLLALMLAVLLRSFVGEHFSGGIPKEHAAIVLLVGFIAMSGKMAGGWIARWLGVARSLIALVALVAGCLLLQGSGPAVMLGGLFLVNCTMPVTLWLANVVLPRREGLAFGLLAAALMPGYLMATAPVTTLALTMMLAVLLTVGLELAVLLLLGERRGWLLWSSVVINIFTNLTLNTVLYHAGTTAGHVFLGETAVAIVEALWYFYFLRRWRLAVGYSLLCNVASFSLGLLLQLGYACLASP